MLCPESRSAPAAGRGTSHRAWDAPRIRPRNRPSVSRSGGSDRKPRGRSTTASRMTRAAMAGARPASQGAARVAAERRRGRARLPRWPRRGGGAVAGPPPGWRAPRGKLHPRPGAGARRWWMAEREQPERGEPERRQQGDRRRAQPRSDRRRAAHSGEDDQAGAGRGMRRMGEDHPGQEWRRPRGDARGALHPTRQAIGRGRAEGPTRAERRRVPSAPPPRRRSASPRTGSVRRTRRAGRATGRGARGRAAPGWRRRAGGTRPTGRSGRRARPRQRRVTREPGGHPGTRSRAGRIVAPRTRPTSPGSSARVRAPR